MTDGLAGMDPAASPFSRSVKRVKCRLAHAFIFMCGRLPARVHRNAAAFGQSMEYSYWVVQRFGRGGTFVSTREKLWRLVLARLGAEAPTVALEFGVAYGYAARWWLPRHTALARWYGFDSFRGIAQPWRHFPAGAFDAGGKPPAIPDPRVEWVIGPVEETVTADVVRSIRADRAAGAPCLFLFDMDLYGPTRWVAECVWPGLRDGDVLYFDEAADLDERRVLLELMDTTSHKLELIGATPMALALRVGKADRGGQAC